MSDLWINIIGYSASICMIFGYLPQAITTIRTRNTDGIAMPTFCMLGLGSIFFVIQGIALSNWPLVIKLKNTRQNNSQKYATRNTSSD